MRILLKGLSTLFIWPALRLVFFFTKVQVSSLVAYMVISRSRKHSFVVIDVLGVVGGGLIFVSIYCGKLDIYCLLAGRVLQGLAAGMSMVACRVYIREYSPEALLKAMSYIPVFFY
jgi:MFS family permease